MPPKPKASSRASARKAPRKPGRKKGQASPRSTTALPISGPPIFSQEIFDIIIDYNHDEPCFLRNCSRVCRGWLPSSRLHLLAQTSVDISKRTEIAWMQVIRSPLATIGHYIRSIKLEATNVGPLKFQHCLERLDKIASLHIYKGIIPPDISSPLFSKVTDLSLESEFLCFDDLFRFIATFPQLERLSLRCMIPGLVIQWSDIEPASQMTHMPPLLRFLELVDASTIRTFVGWLLQQITKPIITELSLARGGNSILPLMRIVGSNLTRLRLTGTRNQHLANDQLALSQYPRLESLFIEVMELFWLDQPLLHWLGTALPKLQRLSLFFEHHFCEWIERQRLPSANWDELDRVLSAGPFSHIEVIFRWYRYRSCSRIKVFVEESLEQSCMRHDVSFKISLKHPSFDLGGRFDEQVVDHRQFVPPANDHHEESAWRGSF
ncbi:hypothetical protein C8J56DRAFT_381877 [Mycena floridula]|nr:hypothetical protein C8J56DRAFT_381877 [Mycena floridula]